MNTITKPTRQKPEPPGNSVGVMTSSELRASFVDFFVAKRHRHVPSATLIPAEMSTTLFTIAGMEPFVPAFLGEVPPPAPRAVSVQRCLRVAGAKSDIENVGRTGRHGTFLEMLGNFSFGDYYKREAILMAWEYLTQVLRLDERRLYVTVHTSDDEAQRLWEFEVGIASSKITRFDQDNFWTMGPTGPCGPCSEIFYDTSAANASGPDDTGPNLGTRFVELWNLVFQQYNRTADGELHDLPRKGIDTGAGFERMLAAVNGKTSMYETDLFTDLIAAQPPIGPSSLAAAEQLVRQRIIADHARAATFLIADGVFPSNTDRGYVLRFLIRRAIRSGRLLGYPRGFLTALVPAVVRSLESGYPELRDAADGVQSALGTEEAAFEKTLERGSEMLAKLLDTAKAHGTSLPGSDVFTLHDTYGFPSELTKEIAAEAAVTVNMAEFEAAMDAQRERAREDAMKKRAVVAVADVPAVASVFTGYDGLDTEGTVAGLIVDGKNVAEISTGVAAQIILDRTSFYAEKGGQVGDHGTIRCGAAIFEVGDTQFAGEAIAHSGTMQAGTIRVGDRATTAVDATWREEIRRHHTSAHLLQRALKDILGDEVTQAGSWVGIDRMRFDFRTPSGALSPHQQRAVTERVNQFIREDHHLTTRVLPLDEAKQTGALTMAGEQYADPVRVVQAGPSTEFCGGTHSVSTGELGIFIIISESSIGSGVRRIEAVVSKAAEKYVLDQLELVDSVAESLSAKPQEIGARIDRMQHELRDVEKSRADIRTRMAEKKAERYVERAEQVNGVRFVGGTLSGTDVESLRQIAQAARSKVGEGVVAFAGTEDDSVSLIVLVSDGTTKRGLHAGVLLKAALPPIEGRGGGNATLAQGGGKKTDGAGAAIDAIRQALAS